MGFTRDWQCFWAIFLTSLLLTFGYVTVKNPKTAITDNPLLQMWIITMLLSAVTRMNVLFGTIGVPTEQGLLLSLGTAVALAFAGLGGAWLLLRFRGGSRS